MSGGCPGMLDDDYWSTFSADFADYELGGPIGFGASSTVYSASFQPTQSSASPTTSSPSSSSSRKPSLTITIPAANPGTGSRVASGAQRECAIKVSSLHPDVGQLFRESRLLGLSKHANVLRVLATFTLPPDHRRIAIVTPLIEGGSLAGILDWRARMATSPRSNGRLPRFRLGKKHADDEGDTVGRLDEEEIKAVTKQVLDGLVYLHGNGFLHRDLKAGNILVSHDGTILLADFGVAGDINGALTPAVKPLPMAEEMHYRQTNGTGGGVVKDLPARTIDMSEDVGKRKSFVGTPSWMAPEIVLGQRYDAKADIWSLGITLLELAHGSAPRSSEKTNNILRSTALDAAPTLDRSVGSFSKNMKEFIDLCLQKDPEDRPSAGQLQEHQWLRGAKKGSFLAETLLSDVPALEARQEIRRVPTMSTLHSRASSWDFSASPSVTTSPVRTTFGATPGAPPLSLPDHIPSTSRAHSRSSSRIPSLPPSPRVPLRQWAERTASEHSDDWKRRSTSDSPYLPRMGSRTMRKTSTLSFDEETKGDPLVKPSSSRRTPSAEGTMSPLVEAQSAPHAPPPIELDMQVEGLMLETSDDRQVEQSTLVRGWPQHQRAGADEETSAKPRDAPADSLGFTASPEADAIDLDEHESDPPDIRRGRSGTFIAPGQPPPPPAPELQRSETFKGAVPEKEKEKKGWLGRKVSLKTDGLARRLTGKKK